MLNNTANIGTPSVDNNSLSMLFENIDTILKNKETIIADPSNYYIRIQGTGITAVYAGFTALYLGDLLQLWTTNSHWIEDVDGTTQYIYHLGGFPTSGMSFLSFYNVAKKQRSEEQRKHFIEYYRDAEAIIKENRPSTNAEELESSKTIQELIKELI